MQKGSRNPELYENGVLKSQKRANKKYDTENVDNIRLRVPKGWKAQMKAYAEAKIPDPEYPNDKDKEIQRYPSVNAMICELIRKEVNPS